MPRRSVRHAGLVAHFLVIAASLYAGDIDVSKLSKPAGYVSDLAHVVGPTDKDQLEAFCTKVEEQLGVQLALVTIDTIGDQPIRDFALNLARRWGVGDRKNNQGVLLLLVIRDHKSDIETGRGIEPYLTDGFSGATLRSMRPELRARDYGPALMTAARTMAAQIAQGKGIAFSDAAPMPRRVPEGAEHRGGSGIPFPLIVLGILFLLLILGRGGRSGGGGFWMGMLLGNLLSGGRRSRDDGWGSGGGFGGGDSGGGFGGFGGGDFGGGGASSDW